MIDIRNSRCQSSNKSDVLCGKMGQLICWQIDVLSWLVFFLITLKLVILVCFFFSSRRRHTRYIGDWSSDVCSSDLRLIMNDPRLIVLAVLVIAIVAVGVWVLVKSKRRERLRAQFGPEYPRAVEKYGSVDRKSVV